MLRKFDTASQIIFSVSPKGWPCSSVFKAPLSLISSSSRNICKRLTGRDLVETDRLAAQRSFHLKLCPAVSCIMLSNMSFAAAIIPKAVF